MKTIIQSRKTRSFTYRQLWGSCAELSSFLMCFSLPDSNSIPGPRQLHINWPRRRCQGCSVQDFWCCYHQLNTDLEVCSSSLHQLSLLNLSLSPSFLISLFLSFVFVCKFFLPFPDICFLPHYALSPSSSVLPVFTQQVTHDWDQRDVHGHSLGRINVIYLPCPLLRKCLT